MSSHFYSALPSGNWMRLLRVQPGNGVEVKCELYPADLDARPVFSAISYVWGDPSQRQDILLNGHLFSVTQNLANVLHRVRSKETATVVWADAICINQGDLSERGQQVQMMGDIYAKAKEVLIWLGIDLEGDALIAMDLIRDVNAYFDRGIKAHPRLEDIPQIPEGAPLLDVSRWRSVERLASSPWFTRVWVMQEVGLAATARVLYGRHSIPWVEVIQFIMSVDHRLDLNKTNIALPMDGIVDAFNMIWCSYGNDTTWRNEKPFLKHIAERDEGLMHANFANILLAGGWLSATDPRDRVYAFLGHPAARVEGGARTVVKADYQTTATSLYTAVHQHLILEDKSLQSLTLVRHSDTTLDGTAASWVERWDQPNEVIILGSISHTVERPYDADLHNETGDRVIANIIAPVNAHDTSSHPQLHARGLIIDEIVEATSVLSEDDMTVRTGHDPGLNLVEGVWRKFVDSTSTSRDEVDAFSTVLGAGLLDNDIAATTNLPQHRADFQAYTAAHCSPELARWASQDCPEKSEVGVAHYYSMLVARVCHGRKIFRTRQGRLGLGPSALRPGDTCAVLFGSRIPFVLRPSGEASQYLLLGDAYVQDLMSGEAVALCKDGIIVEESITLL
ncbi:hypothetical protein Q7P37_004777 [Cladosporium fusiforme]